MNLLSSSGFAWICLTTSLLGQAAAPAVPPTAAETSVAQPLLVTKFWYPWQSTNASPVYFMFQILDIDEGGLWMRGQYSGGDPSIYRVSLPDFTTQVIALPDKHYPQAFVATPQALYMDWQTHGNEARKLARYDLKTSTWAEHALPDYFFCKLYNLENSLYVFLGSGPAASESSMARYDWDQDKLTILSSTRRRPAQNQFDNRARLFYGEMFLGPGGKPCVTAPEGTYFIQESPGPWPEVFNGSFDNQSITSLGKTLVVGQNGEVTLLDPGRPAPEYLMAAEEPQFRKRPAPGTPAAKEVAPWAGQTIWNPPANGRLVYTKVAFNGDRLFILNKPMDKGGAYDLLCYEKGQGKEPRHIPLEFHLDDQSRSTLSTMPLHAPATWQAGQIEHPDTTIYPSADVQFFATKDGLCIQPYNVGFWFLPYGDIDAYLNAGRN